MNKVQLNHKKKLSPFFFEKKLYQYVLKTLNEHDRELMRKYLDTNKRAKRSLASMLMGLEYLNQLQQTKIDESWVERQVKREQKKENITKHTILTLLVFSLLVVSFLTYRVI